MKRRRWIVRMSCVLALVAAQVGTAQAPRATLTIQWSSDSSWEGTYLDKPHRFHVRESIDGRLVFALADAALLPRAPADSVRGAGRTLDVIQLNDNGTSSGAALVSARGSTTYLFDVSKEGGSCEIVDQPDTSGLIRAPFQGREEGKEDWNVRAPGSALLLIRGGAPVAFAFAPSAIHIESSHRLLCPHPETVRRNQTYRVTVRFGDLLEHRRAAPAPSNDGQWTLETSRTPLGGYVVKGRYDVVVRQHRAIPTDPASASGQLVVSKRMTLTWEPGDASAGSPASPAERTSRTVLSIEPGGEADARPSSPRRHGQIHRDVERAQ
jgi:hypothetical protein